MNNKNQIQKIDGVDLSLTKEQVEDLAAKNQQKLLEHQKNHDLKTITRRDLLHTGVIGFAGTLMSHSLLQMLIPSQAQASGLVCQVAGTHEWIPMITIHLQGGSCLTSHWLPLDSGGNPLAHYGRVGRGKSGSFGVDYEFSNRAPFFAGSSFLAGVRTTASIEAITQTSFVGMSVGGSQDDSANNALDISGLVRGMGAKGRILPNMGTANTSTGINARPAFMPPPAPLRVSGYEDITGALGVAGSLSPLVAANRAGKLFETIQQLSIRQSAKYITLNGGSQILPTITCRTAENTQLVGNPAGNNTDPRGNALVATTWGIAANTAMTSRAYQFGSVVFNCLNGNGSTGNLNMGGYDYHGSARVDTDADDNDAGQVVGRILETAKILGKKVFIMVTTDGATTAQISDIPGAQFTSDGGDRNGSYILAYNPSGTFSANGYQLGYMNQSEAAADPMLASPDRAAAAALINYLSLNGKLNEIDKVLPRTFSPVEIDKMRKLG
jgi:hypothetical protein